MLPKLKFKAAVWDFKIQMKSSQTNVEWIKWRILIYTVNVNSRKHKLSKHHDPIDFYIFHNLLLLLLNIQQLDFLVTPYYN